MISHLEYDNLTRQRDLATEAICRSVYVYEAVTSYARLFRYEEVHPSFINNLKDAIVHFQKLDSVYLSIDKNSPEIDDSNLVVFVQFELLAEHMTRGIVDIYVEMLQYAAVYYETFLNCMLQEVENNSISRVDEFIKKIRVAMHYCKNEVLNLRNCKLNLVRIAHNQPSELNVAFYIRLDTIRKKIREHYEELQSHLHDVIIHNVYDFVMNACEKGYSLHRIKEGDTLEKVSNEIGCDISHLRSLNNLKRLDFGIFPKGTTWLTIKNDAVCILWDEVV